MPFFPNTTWVILAGGQALRMGGQDKGLVTLNNKPLIEYVFERLLSQGATVAINANRNQNVYRRYGPVFGDDIQGFPGPLGGMHAAMAQLGTQWLGFVPCDSPNLPLQLLNKMYAAIEPNTEILVAHDGQSIQPVVTLMKRDIFNRLDRFLANGDRKIVLLHALCQTKLVDFSDYPDAFINLNTPQELDQYGTIL